MGRTSTSTQEQHVPTTRQEPRTLPPGMAHARRAGLLMLVGALGVGVPLPWTAIALLPLGLSVMEAVRALRAMSGGRAPARVVAWTSTGLVLAVVMGVATAAPFAFYDSSKRYQDCMVGANTSAAAAQCRADLYDGLTGVLTGWGVSR
ncbi:hypothetical protein [Oryzihumus sp.]|jgi:hypothetical protein|uniref:hypothetical protein n=1 Tax=Oryzihumus sp. TaxID=1968903 RepID=UPI002ED8CBC2